MKELIEQNVSAKHFYQPSHRPRMRPHHFLLIRLRFGVAIATTVGIVHIASGWGIRDRWLGVWSATFSTAAIAVALTVPATAFCMASAANWFSRRGLATLESTSSRPAGVARARLILEGWIWASFGAVAGTIVEAALTANDASFGVPNPLPMLPNVAMLLFASALGVWIGPRLPLLVAGPALAAATYLSYVVGFNTIPDVVDGLTPTSSFAEIFYETKPWIRVAQAVFWIVVAGVITFMASRAKRQALVAALIAGLIAAPLLASVNKQFQDVPAASELFCKPPTGEVVICLTAPFAYLRNDIARPTSAAVGLVEGLIDTPLLVIDDSATQQRSSARDQVTEAIRPFADREQLLLSKFSALGSQTQVDRETYLASLSQYLFPPSIQRPDDGSITPDGVLQRWFLESLRVPTDGSVGYSSPVDGSFTTYSSEATTSYQWLKSLSPDRRTEWFKAHKALIDSGRLTWADFV